MNRNMSVFIQKNFWRVSLWLGCLSLIQISLWSLAANGAMYRCHDQSGTTVLTDNPAQLSDCSILKGTVGTQPLNQKELQPPPFNATPNNSSYKNQAEPLETTQLPQAAHKPSLEEDISIPLKKIGGSFVVQANLNNERNAYLIVDTGASMTVLSTDVAIDLGILGTTDNELLTVNTAGGSVQVNMNFLSSLHVGTAQAQHVAVAIHDLPDIPEQIEGLLGMSFLRHFLVTLDAEHARLILKPKPSS